MSGDVTISAGGGLAIAGSDVKSISNVGGGSTPSTVTVRVPATMAAGTSHAHDVVGLGHSTLILASSTTLGAFTEFDSGFLVNKGTLDLHAGKVTASTFNQTAGGTLAVDVSHGAHGMLQLSEAATLHGVAAGHNASSRRSARRCTILKRRRSAAR